MGGVWALASGRDSDVTDATDVTASPTTEAAATPQAVFDGNAALAVVDSYLTAFSAGDVAQMMAHLAPEAVLEIQGLDLAGTTLWFDSFSASDWEQRLAWYVGQRAERSPHACLADSVTVGASVTATCEYELAIAPVQAVGAPASPVVVTIVVAPGGITELRNVYGPPIPWLGEVRELDGAHPSGSGSGPLLRHRFRLRRGRHGSWAAPGRICRGMRGLPLGEWLHLPRPRLLNCRPEGA